MLYDLLFVAVSGTAFENLCKEDVIAFERDLVLSIAQSNADPNITMSVHI